MIDIILSLIGFVVFTTGLFFIAKSTGQEDCSNKPGSLDANRAGGWVGFAIGVLILCIASLFKIKTQIQKF